MTATVTHIEKIGRRKVDEYEVRDEIGVIATAHCIGVQDDTWSIKLNGRFLGLVKGRSTAVKHLETIAAKASKVA